jgi:hypothetical protein
MTRFEIADFATHELPDASGPVAPPDMATSGFPPADLLPPPDMAPSNSAPADLLPISRRIFVTDETYQGNLIQAAAKATALEAADRLCQVAATKAQLTGNWRAWISANNTNAIDRMADGGPWLLVGTQITVFADRANLTTAPAVGINRNQYGVQLSPGTTYAWTQTSTGGKENNLGCYDWSSSASGDFGNAGNPNGVSDWTASNGIYCNSAAHLYCLEQ